MGIRPISVTCISITDGHQAYFCYMYFNHRWASGLFLLHVFQICVSITAEYLESCVLQWAEPHANVFSNKILRRAVICILKMLSVPFLIAVHHFVAPFLPALVSEV